MRWNGSIRAVAGAALLIGLAGFAPGAGSRGTEPAEVPAGAHEVRWSSAFATALEQARAEQKYVMVDFFTSWCGWCKVLDRKTYTDARVIGLTDRMVSVKVNAEIETAVAARYGVRAYPTILFLNPDGSPRKKIQGYQPPEAFVPVLQEVLRTDSEVYALARQVRDAPRDPALRLEYARVFARSANLPAATAQLDTLLALGDLPKERKAEAELERLILLARQGRGEEAEDVRKGLEKWIKKGKKHPRLAEAQFYLAQVRERLGKSKDARKVYEEIVRKQPGSWFAESARERLQELG